MKEKEFDKFADNYVDLLNEKIKISGGDVDYFTEYKLIDVYSEAKTLKLTSHSKPLRILDFGCGVGSGLPYVKKYFPISNLFAADVSELSINAAQKKFSDIAEFHLISSENELPSRIKNIDIAYAMCVFHHIHEELHIKTLSMIRERLSNKGILVVYEHNPNNPLTVSIVNSCEFDVDAKLIDAATMVKRCKMAGYINVKVKYRVFLPTFLKWFCFIERFLTWLPLGGQYYIVCTNKND